MKKLLVVLLFAEVLLPCAGQRRFDIGAYAGPGYYLGDINPQIPFLQPGPGLGMLFMYNFNPRYAVKSQLGFASIRGSDALASNPFQNIRNRSFSSSLLDMTILFEFNFDACKLVDRAHPVCTYVNGGAGFSLPMSGPASPSFLPMLPFGAGVKAGINRRVGIGLEYSCRKLFSDRIDGVTNYRGEGFRNFYTNNDWYTIASVYITYKLFDNPADCPVYW